MNKQDSLSKTSKDLMLKEPYYGFFLLMLHKSWDDKIKTAGVCKNGINFQLMISEKFWTALSEEHRLGLLKHELLHIAFQHLTTFTMFADKKLANIAMDMEINQYIDKDWLPEGGIDIDDYSDLNLDRRAGSRYYYDKLQQAQKDKKEQGSSGDENMDKLLNNNGYIIFGNDLKDPIDIEIARDSKHPIMLQENYLSKKFEKYFQVFKKVIPRNECRNPSACCGCYFSIYKKQ